MASFISQHIDSKAISEEIKSLLLSNPKRQMPFEQRREDDLNSIKPELDIWSEIVTRDTGIPYDAKQQILKHSDWRRIYTATDSVVLFPIEVLGSGEQNPEKEQITNIPGTYTSFGFNSYDRLGIGGHKWPVTFGFFATLYPEDGLPLQQSKLFQEVGVGVPNEILKWMTAEQRKMLEKALARSSHDFAHSHELFIPDGYAPQEQKDWHALMMLSPSAHPQVSISNLEAKAISEHRIIIEELFKRDPHLRNTIIEDASEFLASVEKSKEEKISNDLAHKEHHEAVAAFVSIIYLNHLFPGIALHEIPGAEKYADALKQSQQWAYKDIEKKMVIPWGAETYATPQQISALHMIALDETLKNATAHPKLGVPAYQGPLAGDAFFIGAPISKKQAKELSEHFGDLFCKENGVIDRLNALGFAQEAKELEDIFTGFTHHSALNNGPNGPTLINLINHKTILNNIVRTVEEKEGVDAGDKASLKETIDAFRKELLQKDKEYGLYKEACLKEANQRMLGRASSVSADNTSPDGLRAHIESKIAEQKIRKKFKASVIQMNSTEDLERNIAKAEKLVTQAVYEGADLIVLPEFYSCFAGGGHIFRSAFSEEDHPALKHLQELIKKLSIENNRDIWAVAGTMPIKRNDGDKRYSNRSYLINGEGEVVTHFDKIHMSDVTFGNRRIDEKKSFKPGDEIKIVQTPFGKMGFAVCHDLNFAEYFSLLKNAGAEIIVSPTAMPANFSETIDNVKNARGYDSHAFVLCASQAGKTLDRESYGCSCILSPTGKTLATTEKNGADGVYTTEIDLGMLDTIEKSPMNPSYKVGHYDQKGRRLFREHISTTKDSEPGGHLARAVERMLDKKELGI